MAPETDKTRNGGMEIITASILNQSSVAYNGEVAKKPCSILLTIIGIHLFIQNNQRAFTLLMAGNLR